MKESDYLANKCECGCSKNSCFEYPVNRYPLLQKPKSKGKDEQGNEVRRQSPSCLLQIMLEFKKWNILHAWFFIPSAERHASEADLKVLLGQED